MNLVNFETTLEEMIEELAQKECAGEEGWKILEWEYEIGGAFAEWLFNKWLEER
jgi:hypothetical protein